MGDSILWQSLWNTARTIGQVFGEYASGQLADMVGNKALLYNAVSLSLACFLFDRPKGFAYQVC